MSTYDMGILTFWDVPNYGTFAQAYALQRVLDKRCAGRDITTATTRRRSDIISSNPFSTKI